MDTLGWCVWAAIFCLSIQSLILAIFIMIQMLRLSAKERSQRSAMWHVVMMYGLAFILASSLSWPVIVRTLSKGP